MQKLILTPAATGEDVLSQEPIASLISEGYEVAAVNGFASHDNKPMCFVLLTSSSDNDDEFTEEIKPSPDAQDPSDDEPDPDPEPEPESEP